jgi:hypothetical protein
MCDSISLSGYSPSYGLFQEVDALDKAGGWYKAFVIGVSGSGRRLRYKVHFSGWETTCDELASPDRLRARSLDAISGPKGDETVSQVTQLYAHLADFITPPPSARSVSGPRRLTSAIVSCHAADSAARTKERPEVCAFTRDEINLKPRVASKPPATSQQNRQILAFQKLKERTMRLGLQVGDGRLLQTVEHVMTSWNAQAVEKIVEFALDSIVDEQSDESDGDGCGLGGGASTELCHSANEIVCISSDSSSSSSSSSSSDNDNHDCGTAADSEVNHDHGSNNDALIPDPDADASGSDRDSASAAAASPPRADRSGPCTIASRSSRFFCTVKGCNGSWTTPGYMRHHELSSKHMAAVLQQRCDGHSAGDGDADGGGDGDGDNDGGGNDDDGGGGDDECPRFASTSTSSLSSPTAAPVLPKQPAVTSTFPNSTAFLQPSSVTVPCSSSRVKPSASASFGSCTSAGAIRLGRGCRRPKNDVLKSKEAVPGSAIAPAVRAADERISAPAHDAPERAADSESGHHDECMICFDGGDLLMCERSGCKNVAHFKCVGLSSPPKENERWECRNHVEGNRCGAKRKRQLIGVQLNRTDL